LGPTFDAPFQLEGLFRPLVSESRSNSMRVRASIFINIEADTLHPLGIRRPDRFEFLAEDGLGVHLPQHQRKVVSGVADVLHERPDSAGQAVVKSATVSSCILREPTHTLFPSL
jgi:hypothetical protein